MDERESGPTNNPGVVWGLLVLQFLVMGGGLALLDVDYENSTDLVRMWAPLSLTAIVFVAATARLLNPTELGLQSPRPRSYWWMSILLAILTVVPIVRWLSALTALPESQSLPTTLILKTAVAVTIVGFTEEWMFRGLLLAFLSRRLGLRNGVIVSTILFGLFHAVNVLGGQSVGDTAGQVAATTLLGMVFAIAGLGLRSILPLMLIHAAYDFFIITAEQLKELGAEPASPAIETLFAFIGVAIMIAAAVLIARLPSDKTTDPYARTAS